MPADLARLLRAAVLDLAGMEHRRRFPAVVHVGAPGRRVVSVTEDPAWDRGLRADVVGTALYALRLRSALVWVTRPGRLSLHDVDVAWLAPAVASAAECEVDVTFVVVTRHGWFDPRSGTRRMWKRIRQR